MKAIRLYTQNSIDQNPLILEEIPVPEPGHGQVRIKINACGVCHTDLHIVEGDIHPPMFPIIPGHQAVGTIDQFSSGSPTNLHLGDRVGVPWLYAACGNCIYCITGQENLCQDAKFTGFHVNGGFAEYMIAESAWVLPLPDMLDDRQAAPLLCAGIIGYRSLVKADLQPGERIALVGFGASAHLAIQVARHWGCEVYVFTRSEDHREHARSLGARWTGGIEDDPPVKLDRAIIFAPSGYLVPATLEKLRSGGTLAINAIYLSDIPGFPYSILYGEKTLRSVTNATYQDGVDFLKLAEEIGIHSTISLYSLNEANRALRDLKQSKINGEAVLVI
jgi:propanol-preferring alcohol dehydrogenase